MKVFAYLPSFFSQFLDFIYGRLWFLFWPVLNEVKLKTIKLSLKKHKFPFTGLILLWEFNIWNLTQRTSYNWYKYLHVILYALFHPWEASFSIGFYTYWHTGMFYLPTASYYWLLTRIIQVKKLLSGASIYNPRQFFFHFCWKKCNIFQHSLGGIGDMWYSSSVPTTFGRDCTCSFRWSKSNAPLLVQHFLKGLDWALFQ